MKLIKLHPDNQQIWLGIFQSLCAFYASGEHPMFTNGEEIATQAWTIYYEMDWEE